MRKIESQIVKRRLNFMGEFINEPRDKIPFRLISAFYNKKCRLGRPNYTVKHSMMKDAIIIIAVFNKNDSFHKWAHVANNELIWSILIKNIENNNLQPCNYSSE